MSGFGKVFWSYNHDTNNYCNQQVTTIRDVVGDIIKQENGKEVDLIVDSRHIRTGQDIYETISHLIEQSSCMVVFVSNTYFNSDWCKREYQLFKNKENLSGGKGLILPIRMVKQGEGFKNGKDKETVAWIEDLQNRSHRDLSDYCKNGSVDEYITELQKLAEDIFEIVKNTKFANLLSTYSEDCDSILKAPDKSDIEYAEKIDKIWHSTSETQKKIMKIVENCNSKAVKIDSLIGTIKSNDKKLVGNADELYYRLRVLVYLGLMKMERFGRSDTVISFDDDAYKVLHHKRLLY